MATALGKTRSRRRTASKEFRQLQLIRATLKSIAKRGIADTTLGDVSREAGLSAGIINLHFESKDKLFVETLRYLADDYKSAWERALERAGPGAAERLSALMKLDFAPSVCDRKKLAVWFAFWGEARSRPTYRKLCRERDAEYEAVLVSLCERTVAEGGYADVDAAYVARALTAISNGLWLDLLITPEQLDRETALKTCLSFLASVFPNHFSPRVGG